ncbi:MAG: hypothetical protein JNL38_12645 [Myxococcales bacterium]|jgi:acyl carrier protein|nr:hypothetical protein [Myxococcales bacterium]
MVDFSEDFVAVALAMHLDRDAADIRPHLELERDLGLDPLDLVLVVLRLEEIAGADLPLVELDGLRTVADLERVVRSWLVPVVDRDSAPPQRSGFFRAAAAAAPAKGRMSSR